MSEPIIARDQVPQLVDAPERRTSDLREWLRQQTRTHQHSERLKAFREVLELLDDYEVDVDIVLCACCDRRATRDVDGVKLCEVCKRWAPNC